MKVVIETEKVPVVTEEQRITKVNCDWCGKEIKFPDSFCAGQPYGEVNVSFGFGSKYDCIDGRYIAEVCDVCFEKHFIKIMRKR